jgi:hypothetical protein
MIFCTVKMVIGTVGVDGFWAPHVKSSVTASSTSAVKAAPRSTPSTSTPTAQSVVSSRSKPAPVTGKAQPADKNGRAAVPQRSTSVSNPFGGLEADESEDDAENDYGDQDQDE